MTSELAVPGGMPPALTEGGEEPSGRSGEITIDPQRLLRVAAVAREVLAEARRITPEPGMVEHLHRVHDRICSELRASLPAGLYDELSALTPDVADGSLQELVLAHAEIIGWLRGLFQAIQLAMTQAQKVLPEAHLPADGSHRPDPRYL